MVTVPNLSLIARISAYLYFSAQLTSIRPGLQVRFEVGDAQQLRFDDESFDAALSLLAFNFIPDAKKALEQLCRVSGQGESYSRPFGTMVQACGC